MSREKVFLRSRDLLSECLYQKDAWFSVIFCILMQTSSIVISWLQNLGLCSALITFKKIWNFYIQDQLWHGLYKQSIIFWDVTGILIIQGININNIIKYIDYQWRRSYLNTSANKFYIFWIKHILISLWVDLVCSLQARNKVQHKYGIT